MSNIFELNANKRSEYGKRFSRRLRKQQKKVPAIIYGSDQTPQPITLLHDDIIVALKEEAFYSHILTINVDGKQENVILKDLQRHPYKNKVLHLDFMRIKADEKITTHVPLHFTNETTAVGVKEQGGIITHLVKNIEIRCLPKDLPEYITIDIKDLHVGESKFLSDITLPVGVEIIQTNNDNSAIVTIHRSKTKSAQSEAGEEKTTD